MPLNIQIEVSGTNKKIGVPFKSDLKVSALIVEVIRRAKLDVSLLPFLKIYLNGSELFLEDTMVDLGISDNTDLLVSNTAVAVQPIVPSQPIQVKEEPSLLSSNSVMTNEIEQLDMVVIDISASMTGKAFKNDILTRIEAAQAFFQAYLDKYHQHEIAAAVGLVQFGHLINLTFPITREFETFSTELGEIEANQSRTRLYEAILLAAETLQKFKSAHASLLAKNATMRVFCLTDGQDNSNFDPFITYQYLQQHGIIIDSIGIGTDNFSDLSKLTRSTGGKCFTVHSIQSGVELFEREAVLSLQKRSDFKPFPLSIHSRADLLQIQGETFADTNMQIKADPAVHKKAVTPNNTYVDNEINTNSNAAVKRIFKEFKDILSDTKFQVFIDENDVFFWKIVLSGPASSPYNAGWFLLTCKFPTNYPFSPPKIRFATPIYHCNINNDGALCLDILKDQWSPAMTIGKVMYSILSLLQDPNPNDALDSNKGAMYNHERPRYLSEAVEFTKRHASKSFDELAQLYNLKSN
jgi:ubiquitin-protein ligase